MKRWQPLGMSTKPSTMSFVLTSIRAAGGTEDGLATRWDGRRVFCNPPYGPGLAKWLERGLEANLAVFLIPARTDTRWFHDIVLPKAKEIRFIKGRLKFGDAVNSAPFPSMIVVFK